MAPSSESILFERMESNHSPRVAAFHSRNLGGKLNGLGPGYIRFFYETALTLSGAFGWVALKGEEIVGLVFGSLQGEKITGCIIRKNPLGWLIQSLRSAFLHPLRFFRVALSTLGASAPGRTPVAPELHYIAVRSDQRGRHIGRQLLLRFSREIQACGQSQFALSVARDNEPANFFYKANGGQPLGEFETAGMKMRRYVFEAQKLADKGD